MIRQNDQPSCRSCSSVDSYQDLTMAEPYYSADDDEGSISRVIRRMKQGDETGAPLLWDRFYTRLRFLVRERLHTQLQAVADEEDVALDSLSELFRGLLNGQYPGLDNRESLWRLLVTVSTRNVMDEVARERRLKRGGGRVYHESAFQRGDETISPLFDRIASPDAAPDVQVMIAERCTELLESLKDEQLQAIAIMKTAGTSNQEVADSIGISLRSVERRLGQIREIWGGGPSAEA